MFSSVDQCYASRKKRRVSVSVLLVSGRMLVALYDRSNTNHMQAKGQRAPKRTFILRSFYPAGAGEELHANEVSFVEFINKITFVNVASSTDGIHRKGIISKK